ncbi:MAG TPA: HAMP domain-containing sensor histidine kinase [Intrasporangium sp.]|uniref:sensor histidine kinase n=1 Tax=Intrasporangium sp. TaxID=1925024 RepID=UPI002D791B93|nr:HAMP domain-containing sensor histidine kinase [Intrasporangium sp.]HET7397216.1 HAMP domain-containing sensor histidine kinase [Intrasporangium sp.]
MVTGTRTFLAWLPAAGAGALFMWLMPGSETVPYHLAWGAFALLYGLAPWRDLLTVLGLTGFTGATGAVLLSRAATGVVAWEETAEIPLMLLLMLLLVWHVKRRQRALAALTVLADREREEARGRDLLTQRTSHEMRSPLTIARGYVEVLRSQPHGQEEAAELEIIDEELARLTRVCERLVRSIAVHGDPEPRLLDLDSLLVQTVQRWSGVADRVWVVEPGAGTATGVEERLRAFLDTLVENAIRYTTHGDTIRVFGTRDVATATVALGVADSGPGLSPALVEALNGARDVARSVAAMRDELSQTGLGLGLVLDIAARRGGWVRAERAPEGGAKIALVSPIERAGAVDPVSSPAVPSVRAGRRVWAGTAASSPDARALIARHGRPSRRR